MAIATKEKRPPLAEESSKTKKAREKLRRRLEAMERKVTPEALKEKRIEIHRWIARHAPHRQVLRNKSISLFDENQNAASLSRRVDKIAQQIHTELVIASAGKDLSRKKG